MLHEWLTNPGWINPQIDYLLFLQNIRNQFGGEDFFLSITKFGEIYLPTIAMCIVYWAIDFKSGLYLFTLNVANLLTVQILKHTACIYRPWILSSEVQPSQNAILRASGYSFPSGHTSIASIWAGFAYLLREKPLFSFCFIFLVLLIAFSRNYIGVHTPQDVITSLLVICVTVAIIDKILKWCEQNKNRYLQVLGIFNCLIGIAIAYVILKNYPIDYFNGKLLVNPTKAVYAAIINSGWICGLINGVILCARFFPIETNTTLTRKILRVSTGLILYTLINTYLMSHVYHYSGQSFMFAFCNMFIGGIFITAIYPFIFTKIEKIIKKP